jgi:hypothetical protein
LEKSAWKSALRVNRSRRESGPVRRSAVYAPSPGVASVSFAHPASSSARGSRGSWLAGAGSAEKSASCRLCLPVGC